MRSKPWLVALLGTVLSSGLEARPPQATEVSAGPDRLLLPPAGELRLEGTFRTPRLWEVPNDLSIAWTQVAGPQAQILGADTLTPTLVPGHAGSVRLRLEVSEPRLGSFADEVWVHVFGADQDATIAGEARKWNKLELTFTHDQVLSESGTPNPFLDLRLVAYFLHPETGLLHIVPGFFAADGDAAETSATAGDKWRVNFTPDRVGRWLYIVSFRTGPGIAISDAFSAGIPLGLENANGEFFVEPTDPDAPGFLSKGRLDYVGGHHLRFAETGESFLKGGAGSPENFLGYYEFDNTSDFGGEGNGLNSSGYFDGLHHYDAHLNDYVDLGVPLWKNGKGQRIFGTINYLASMGVNSLYCLSYNTDGGDGSEVFPWTGPSSHTRFDVSKLAQWERLVDHMQRAGIVWHAVTQEFENDHALDGGVLGLERRLYYREMVARFGHALGLVWNLGEENTNTPEERRTFADYIRSIDTYAHPISLHNLVGDLAGTFGTLLGTHLEVVSLQGDPTMTPPRAQRLVEDSAEAGRPWVVNFDEQTPANDGVVPDAFDFWHDLIRREALWPMLTGQGGGCEWFFGYGFANDDLDCEDFRSRDNLWRITTRAREFLQGQVPFQDMQGADDLASGTGAGVLAQRGAFYVVYLPFGGPVTLDLEQSTETFNVRWYDARNGGPLVSGAIPQVQGPGVVSLGAPPGTGDWAALVVRAQNLPPEILALDVEPAPFTGGHDFSIGAHVRDPNGPADALSASAEIFTPAGIFAVKIPLVARGGTLHSAFLPAAPSFAAGSWRARVTVTDAAGASAVQTIDFRVQ